MVSVSLNVISLMYFFLYLALLNIPNLLFSFFPFPPCSVDVCPSTRRRQKCPVCCWSPHPWIISILSITFHPLMRHLLSLSPSFSPSLSVYLVSLSLSLGIYFLSAFYSKSNHKAFIQPKRRESGYIWPAWEMLYQERRVRAAQRGKGGDTSLIWCWLITAMIGVDCNYSHGGELYGGTVKRGGGSRKGKGWLIDDLNSDHEFSPNREGTM